MKILIAPDKFKGTLTSTEVCDIISRGIRSVLPDCEIILLPLSDGGDGFADAIGYYEKLTVRQERVMDPLFHEIDSSWSFSPAAKTAFIESAKASGLQLLTTEQYDCSATSTFGTGQLISAARDSGSEKIIIGIGGTATNDGGTGMAAALGYRFLDSMGLELAPVGKNLVRLSKVIPPLQNPPGSRHYIAACDVNNYLCGDEGATKMFAPQKGAGAEMVVDLEEGMLHYQEVIRNDLGVDLSVLAGAGAGGGLGAGCAAFLGASLTSGANLVLQHSRAENYVQSCDAIVTGEGRLDDQTVRGKLVSRIVSLGKQYQRKVFALCGASELTGAAAAEFGLAAVFSLKEESARMLDPREHPAKQLYHLASRLACTLKDTFG